MKDMKRCPRCKEKLPQTSAVCPNCSLNFKKFATATNREAKNAISAGEYERVLNLKGIPMDVSKKDLILAVFLGGLFGYHLFFVGRFKQGLFYSISIVFVVCINILINLFATLPIWFSTLYSLSSLLLLLVLVFWITDIFNILFSNFKIPVSRPYDEEK